MTRPPNHFLNKEAATFYYDHPYEFVTDMIGATPTIQQAQILHSLYDNLKISGRSGHGTGKTATESWIILWFLSTRPYSKAPCTAPTQHQLNDILWSELAKWLARSKVKQYFEWTKTHLYCKKYPDSWFAAARSCSKPENLQGFHADELLFMIDEASGVPQNIMEVIEGALTNEGARCIMMGNPTQLSGMFHDSHHKHRQFWKTFHLSSLESEIVSKDYVERMAQKYGKESNIYRIRVLGEFPFSEDDTLISIDKAERAALNDLQIPEKETPVETGVDVARFGNDKTIISSRQGLKAYPLKKFHHINTMETVGHIMLEISHYKNAKKHIINIDEGGVGGGVVDRLKEILSPEDKLRVIINGVNNGSSSQNERYVNHGSELWFNLRENISNMQIPNDEELISQLTTRKYKMTSNGKLSLESKDDMKERGLESPDCADALALAFRSNITKKGIISW